MMSNRSIRDRRNKGQAQMSKGLFCPLEIDPVLANVCLHPFRFLGNMVLGYSLALIGPYN